jgi:Putative metal-binding motif
MRDVSAALRWSLEMMPDTKRACYSFSVMRGSCATRVARVRRRAPQLCFAAVVTALAGAGVLASSCHPSAENPFATTSATGGGGGGQGGAGGGSTVDPELGGPCVDDSQCNDGIDCTFDSCDHVITRCRFKHDDSLCQNGIFCDGVERCDQKLGCVPGEPKNCGDGNVCTIDTCVEATQSCASVPRDADGDGDPDIHCGGGDCDDNNDAVSSLVPEICGNGIDDNCSGQIDEQGCISPAHDTCLDPLEISAAGTYQLDTAGASFDFPTSCTPPIGMLRDVVAAILLPAGPPIDVVVTATAAADVSLAVAGQCGAPGTEIACGASYVGVTGHVSKLRARGLGDSAQATAYPLYVTTGGMAGPVALDVQMVPPEAAPTNETCATAATIVPGTPAIADLVGAAPDLDSECAHLVGDLVYQFDLALASDVDVYGTSVDGIGMPSLSLRDANCALPSDELTCSSAPAVHLFRHSLPAGTYYVSVSGTAPGTVSVDVAVSAPSTPDPDDTCVGSPILTPNVTHDVLFDHHQDDISLGCFVGGVDAAYELDLVEDSDVLVVQRLSNGDSSAIELANVACSGPSDLIACTTTANSPTTVGKRDLAAGTYRVVTESSLGEPQQITAFVRKTAPAVIVPFADGCADAVTIPAIGGFFQGNTANATANFSAGCDNAGGQPNGAKDQLLRLNLASEKRVVFDMSGSGYATLLDVRQGPDCPGTEMPLSCSASTANPASGTGKSFLDLDLQGGTYFIQIDGLGGDAGLWFLNVFVADP